MKHILILGGSYAGLNAAHRILKQTPKTTLFKITLVSPNSHLYWNIASPRGNLPGQVPDEQLFAPIAAGFDPYPAGRVEVLLATATALDVEARCVVVAGEDGETTLGYDYLVVATGSRARAATPFKGNGSTEEMKKLLHTFQDAVGRAGTVVVGGAGITGMEVAGELGYQYEREKKVVLVCVFARCICCR